MKILMVCLGNICRSPLAEGILKKKLQERNIKADIESSGLEPYHIGHHPDERTIRIANENGIDVSKHVMRLFSSSDFDTFDHIYVMDQSNLQEVLGHARNEEDKKKVKMILSVLDNIKNHNVPDPYYGRFEDFEKAYDLLNEACEIIADSLQ